MIIRHGDCIAEMSAMLDEGVRVDAVVCDPPYELGFMGKGWDSTGIANRMETWLLALELLKPGGHLLAFSGTRTQHRMVCAIEDAGFEIRDQIGWLYGTGFPKSLDVSKAIDKAEGAAGGYGELKSARHGAPRHYAEGMERPCHDDAEAVDRNGRQYLPGTDAARQWAGWGTALKPAWEPICVARKPLEGTVAANVMQHGTGALNIDGCRIPGEKQTPWGKPSEVRASTGWGMAEPDLASDGRNPNIGRWPANVLHDGSGEVLEAFAQFGEKTSGSGRKRGQGFHNCLGRPDRPQGDKDKVFAGDTGTAARFFYSSKASARDRIVRNVEEVVVEWTSGHGPCRVVLQADTELSLQKAIAVSGSPDGCEWSTFLFGSSITDLFRKASSYTTSTGTSSTTELRTWNSLIHSLTSACTAAVNCGAENGGSPAGSAASGTQSLIITLGETASLPGASHALSGTQLRISASAKRHSHPTTKPVSLMRYLCRLVTPPGGLILDPFAGSGTTLEAAALEGFRCIGIEREAEYVADIRRRLERTRADLGLFAAE